MQKEPQRDSTRILVKPSLEPQEGKKKTPRNDDFLMVSHVNAAICSKYAWLMVQLVHLRNGAWKTNLHVSSLDGSQPS